MDSKVLRFSKAVTHFSPGSYPSRPTQVTSISNLFIAGDWVKGLKHGANGLSQERAYITGLTAANYIIAKLGIGRPASILDVTPDEPHVALGKQLARTTNGLREALGLQGL